jgi:hypothetical protein
MDRVTKSLLDDFVAAQDLHKLHESAAFERFANYCIVSREHSDTFNVEELCVGGGADTGIDGIAIIVNGNLVTSPEDVDDLVNKNGYLEARFVFVQAETSSSFDSAKVGSFAFGIADFFAEQPRLVRNEFIQAMAGVQERIYKLSASMTRGKPSLHWYYATTGTWQDDANLVARFDEGVKDVDQTRLFSRVSYFPVDADELARLYQATKNRVTADFTFSSKTVLPEMAGVSEAYLGIVPALEYLTLVKDEAGGIRKSLFYDNVRDFQDYNDVNKEIRGTLASGHRAHFAILNNGVTIVAKTLRTVGNRFHIEDYQVVNGCQTSHVLFDNQDLLDATVYVPLKVIAAEEDDLINLVITATNRQTEVKPEQLLALSAFQKRLEAFFAAQGDRQRLYYERRSRQYNNVGGVEKVRIVTPGQQIRVFASMFLNEPHRASRYYKELLELVGERIFVERHRLEPYYISAFAHYRLEYLFRNGQLDQSYRPGRYHLLLALRCLIGGTSMPQLGSHEMERYCAGISAVLWDDEKVLGAFSRATAIVDAATDGATLTRDMVKTATFTERVVAAVSI